MGANTEPIYTLTPNIGHADCVLVGAQSDGGGVISGGTVTMYVAFTAGSNGSFVKEARIKVGSTTGLVANAATAVRLYLSTVNTGTTTTANTYLLTEIAIPAITGVLAAASPDFIAPLNFAMPTGTYILANIGVATTANATVQVTVMGGDY